MATETFTYERQAGAQGKVIYRTREVQFGDGYSQAVADGLHNEVQEWPLSFEGGLTQMLEIKAFFDRHQGYKSFYWSPPGQAPKLFRANELGMTSVGGGIYRISVTFKQVFTP